MTTTTSLIRVSSRDEPSTASNPLCCMHAPLQNGTGITSGLNARQIPLPLGLVPLINLQNQITHLLLVPCRGFRSYWSNSKKKMAPNIKDVSYDNELPSEAAARGELSSESQKPYSMQIVWRNVILFAYLHMSAVYGLYLAFTAAQWSTILFTLILHLYGGLGITAGAHRLWAHKSYKAKLPLRIILMIFNCIAFQNDIYEWSRDHRAHHKFSETDGDPHNAKRGFFFSHMGWLLVKKHPEVRTQGGKVDMSDLAADPVLMFQRKFYLPLVALFCFILPTVLPHYMWGESMFVGYYVCAFLRYTTTLHSTWLVNSVAHFWGNKPYDKFINPVENKLVATLACGEGWHNYHHTFPYDYKTSELGWRINMTTMIIDMFAVWGWAYDRKTVPYEMVKRKLIKDGDGSYRLKESHKF